VLARPDHREATRVPSIQPFAKAAHRNRLSGDMRLVPPVAQLGRHREHHERAKPLYLTKELLDCATINPRAIFAVAPRLAARGDLLPGHAIDQNAAPAFASRAMHLLHRFAKRPILPAPPPLEPRFDLFDRKFTTVELRDELEQAGRSLP